MSPLSSRAFWSKKGSRSYRIPRYLAIEFMKLPLDSPDTDGGHATTSSSECDIHVNMNCQVAYVPWQRRYVCVDTSRWRKVSPFEFCYYSLERARMLHLRFVSIVDSMSSIGSSMWYIVSHGDEEASLVLESCTISSNDILLALDLLSFRCENGRNTMPFTTTTSAKKW